MEPCCLTGEGTIGLELLGRIARATPEQLAAIEGLLQSAKRQADSGNGEPRFVLRKGHRAWRVVFEGRESFLGAEKGLDYVGVLLIDAPGKAWHAAELGERACGNLVIEGQRNLAMDDAETLEEKGKARRKCLAVLEDDGTSEAEKAEARAELEDIDEWARRHLRGTEGNEQRQVRAIRRAIRRLLDGLQEAQNRDGGPDEVLRAFGAHLEEHLWRPSSEAGGSWAARVQSGMAGRFIYEPPEGVKWSE